MEAVSAVVPSLSMVRTSPCLAVNIFSHGAVCDSHAHRASSLPVGPVPELKTKCTIALNYVIFVLRFKINVLGPTKLSRCGHLSARK